MKRILIPILLFPTIVWAADISLFGVKLGQEISKYPNCHSEEGREKICAYPTEDGKESTRRLIELRPDKPKWTTSNLWITVKDNKIIEIQVRTGGANTQQEAFDYLKHKLGKPTDFKLLTKQNSYGAMFKSIEAQWELKDRSSVFLSGIDEKIDEGTVMFMAFPSK